MSKVARFGGAFSEFFAPEASPVGQSMSKKIRKGKVRKNF